MDERGRRREGDAPTLLWPLFLATRLKQLKHFLCLRPSMHKYRFMGCTPTALPPSPLIFPVLFPVPLTALLSASVVPSSPSSPTQSHSKGSCLDCFALCVQQNQSSQRNHIKMFNVPNVQIRLSLKKESRRNWQGTRDIFSKTLFAMRDA